MKHSGQLRKLNDREVQVFKKDRPFRGKFSTTLLPPNVLAALNSASSPIGVEFHADEQGFVQGGGHKYLIWLPGDPEPAMPAPRATALQTTPKQNEVMKKTSIPKSGKGR